MGQQGMALTACWGWVLLGLLGVADIAPGAEPTRAIPPAAPEQGQPVPTPAPGVAEPGSAASHVATEAHPAAQPLVPIPAAESQPAQPPATIPGVQGSAPPAAGEYSRPPSDLSAPTSSSLGLPSGPAPATQPALSDFGVPNSEFRPPSSPATSAPREVASAGAAFLSRALSLPADGTIGGRPVRLQDLLARTFDQRQREELIHAYWHLAASVAEYNFCRDFQMQLGRWQARLQPAALPASAAARWRAVSALAQARREAAEASLVERQHTLAALARLAPDQPLPLPADRPYVGVYRTYFRELFPAGTGPGRTRLIDRTLPLGQRAIEQFAAAVEAADKAVAAVDGSELTGAAALSNALWLLQRRYEEQQTLMQAVVGYNRQITEYALAVSPRGVDAGKLVAMLIKSQPEVVQPSSPATPSSVRPAAAEDRISAPGQPTRAVPPARWTVPPEGLPTGEALPADGRLPSSGALSSPGNATPTLAPLPTRALPEARGALPGAEPAAGVARPERILPQGPVVPVRPAVEPPVELPRLPPSERLPDQAPGGLPHPIPGELPVGSPDQLPEQPVDQPPAGPTEARPTEAHPTEAVPAEPQPSEAAPSEARPTEAGSSEARPIEATLHKPIVPAHAAAVSPPMYGAFEQAPPPQQAEQLSAVLHWDRMPSDMGQAVDLPGCLKAARFDDRLAVTEAFWTVRRRAAEYQLLEESASWFDDLALVVPAGGTPAEPPVLRMARHHATAAACAAEARLLEAQFDLAVLLGQQNDRLWPLPATRPHAGAYAVRLERLAPQRAASWSVRGLAESIGRLQGRLTSQAAVVVASDRARSLAAAECQSGERELDAAVEGVEFQVQATEQFLAAQADYNTAIARYALTALPPQTPVEQVVEALVVEP